MRSGIRFAIDLGAARIGVAKSDSSGFLASPYEVWPAAELIQRLRSLLQDFEILEVVIGLPKDLKGNESLAAAGVRQTALALKSEFPEVCFRLMDERMTTVAARKQLQQAGYTSRSDKSLIDAAAATVLLQDALDSERAQGEPRGEEL